MIISGNLDKEYTTIAGVPAFTKASANLAFGKDMNGLVSFSLYYTVYNHIDINSLQN